MTPDEAMRAGYAAYAGQDLSTIYTWGLARAHAAALMEREGMPKEEFYASVSDWLWSEKEAELLGALETAAPAAEA